MDWDEEAIKLYLDDELLNEISLENTVNGKISKGTNPFTRPQYLLLNLAIGGINGGPIDDAALPMKYEIDYVRVYQKEKGIASGCTGREPNKARLLTATSIMGEWKQLPNLLLNGLIGGSLSSIVLYDR